MEELEKVETEVIQEEPKSDIVDVKNSKVFKNEAVWLNFRHLGIILSNLAIFASILVFLIPLSTILAYLGTAVAFLVLFAFTIVSTLITIGMVWATGLIQNMWSWISNAQKYLEFFNYLLMALPIVAMLGTLFCFSSSIILQFIKQDRRWGRIIIGYIFGGICLIITIISFAGVIVQ